MITTIMQEWKAIRLSNKKKLWAIVSLKVFSMSQAFFHEPEKYQRSGNKCTSYSSKFHFKKKQK